MLLLWTNTSISNNHINCTVILQYHISIVCLNKKYFRCADVFLFLKYVCIWRRLLILSRLVLYIVAFENCLLFKRALYHSSHQVCVRYFYIFYKKKALKNYEKCLFYKKETPFRFRNIEMFLLPSPPFFPWRPMLNL